MGEPKEVTQELKTEDFLEFFESGEFKKVELVTMKNFRSNVIFLKSLSYAEVIKFKKLSEMARNKKANSKFNS